MTDWPSLSEELERKTVESLARSHNMHQAGLITDAIYRARLETVLEITQGLIGDEYTDATSDMLSRLPGASDSIIRVFQMPGGSGLVAIRDYKGVRVWKLSSILSPEERQFTDGTNQQHDKTVFDRIVQKGLTEGRELL